MQLDQEYSSRMCQEYIFGLWTNGCEQMALTSTDLSATLMKKICPASLKAVKAAASFKPRIYSSKDLNRKADPWYISI